MIKCNIISLNVRGLGAYQKRRKMYTQLRKSGASVICIQETHSTLKTEYVWKTEWGQHAIFNHGSSNSRGVAILFNNINRKNVRCLYQDNRGRCIICEVSINNIEILVVNVYAPNLDEPEFFTDIFDRISTTAYINLVIIGDFNVVLEHIDRTEYKVYNHKAAEKIREKMSEYNLVDQWRVMNPNAIQYSWYRYAPKYSASRIDYALVNEACRNKIMGAEYGSVTGTDHNMLTLELMFSTVNRGKGTWKFNNQLLMSKDFCASVSEKIKQILEKYQSVDAVKKWDILKYEVTTYIQTLARRIAHEKNNKFRQLEQKIATLKNQLSSQDDSSLAQQLHTAQTEYDELLTQKAMGAAFRSKARWLSDGEKCSKYFFSLEKQRAGAKTISVLKNSQGVLIDNPNEIMSELHSFYQRLYKSDHDVSFCLENKTTNKLSFQQMHKLENNLQIEELESALFAMKNDKSPGVDGLTVEFYKFFWNDIKLVLYEMMELSYENMLLPDSVTKGLITLLPKKDKDITMVKNWRPLTMLNIDYKIISKALANRIKSVLDSIISDDQSGFMKGRQISNTIRKTMDIIDILKKQHRSGHVISLDFHKCFDMIEVTAITGSMRYFGFGEYMINMIQLLQTNFFSAVCYNGNLSEWIEVTRSCHQGDPVSSYVFLMCGEVMSHMLKANKRIEPLIIFNEEEPLSQFADDTQLFQNATQTSLDATVETLDIVKRNTGLTVNYDKSAIHCINCEPMNTNTDWAWTKEYPVILGVDTSPCSTQIEKLLLRAEHVLNTWHYRQLSLTGKIMIVNTLVASIYMYLLQVLPDPSEEFYMQHDEMVTQYLWGKNKKPKISMITLKAAKISGGRKLVDIPKRIKSLKLPWLVKETNFLCNIRGELVPDALGVLFFDCNLNSKDAHLYINANSPTFWKEICYHWFDFTQNRQSVTPNKQIIWCNSEVRIDKRPVLLNNLAKAGLVYLEQLYNITESRFKTVEEITNEYAHISWLMYSSLLTAIPTEWKDCMRSNTTSVATNELMYDKLKEMKKPTAFVYNVLIEENSQILKLHVKINKLMSVSCTIVEYQKAFRAIHQVTNITKYRDFQYRLLVNAIHTNTKLYHWRIVDSQYCEWCINTQQTVKHLFFDCPRVQNFYQQIECFILMLDSCLNLTVNYKNVVLGNVHPQAKHVVNFLFLTAKQYIYSCKCCNKPLIYQQWLAKVKEICALERYIAKTQNKLSYHSKKWAIFETHDTP